MKNFLSISDNQIVKLSSDLISPGNKISRFNAAGNKLIIIEQLFLKRLKKSELIDLTGNECIDTVLEKNSNNGVNIDILVTKVFLECSEEE